MSDPILNDPGTKIDARPLIASETLRGALVGFCWSLAVAVVVAVVYWSDAKIDPFWAMVGVGATCSIWSAVAAFAERWRYYERTFTDEQRVVLRRHIRNARIEASGLIVIVVLVLHNVLPPVTVWAVIPFLAVVLIWFGSSLVGRVKGHRAVRALQGETRDAACRMDAHPLGVPNDTTSALVRPSKDRLTAARRRLDEAKS